VGWGLPVLTCKVPAALPSNAARLEVRAEVIGHLQATLGALCREKQRFVAALSSLLARPASEGGRGWSEAACPASVHVAALCREHFALEDHEVRAR
jgi:hypothetical protein